MPKLISVKPSKADVEAAEAKRKYEDKILAKLGLARGEAIRFRGKEAGTWITAKVLGVERDGSLFLMAKGSMRSIMADQCQRKTEGPRGGTHWEDVT